MATSAATISSIQQRYPACQISEFRGQTRVVIDRSQLTEAMTFLKQQGYLLLVDVTCVDYLNYRGAEHRFGLVYLLANPESPERLTVRVMLDEDSLEVDSMVPLWEGANWLEREVYDMFGIHFAGHPGLTRILMPQEFTAYPLRKDYPLQGRGERHNFPVIQRGMA
jgi:NADH-quinone oxidoreductase subunit C